MENSANPCLLVFVVTPELEEPVVDWLLAQERLVSFTQQEIRGFNRNHANFSLVEQVTGRQKRIMFHVRTTEIEGRDLLVGLCDGFPGKAIESYMIPLLATETTA
jgi:hypothetical protein